VAGSKGAAAASSAPAARITRQDFSHLQRLGVKWRAVRPAARITRQDFSHQPAAGLLRSLEVPQPDVRLLALALACERQGQDLFHPPNVKGWDGGRTWLDTTAFLARCNWCNDVIWGNPALGIPAYDPLAWAARHGLAAAKATAAFLDLLLQGDCDDQARGLIERAGRDGSADGLRKALQLIVHCPEYQLG
jgi:hypothetical protein